MESMTIACTRCGATCEGDIISPPLAFGFKHNAKCGHGVGPLAVLPSARKSEKKAEPTMADIEKSHILNDEKQDTKVEEIVEKPKSKRERIKVFGKKD